MCASVEMKPKVQWKPQEVGDARNTENLPRKATRREWRERPSGLLPEGDRLSHPHSLKLISYYHVLWMLGMELQDLIFVLCGFGLASVILFSIPIFLLLGIGVFALCHCTLGICKEFSYFYSDL